MIVQNLKIGGDHLDLSINQSLPRLEGGRCLIFVTGLFICAMIIGLVYRTKEMRNIEKPAIGSFELHLTINSLSTDNPLTRIKLNPVNLPILREILIDYEEILQGKDLREFRGDSSTKKEILKSASDRLNKGEDILFKLIERSDDPSRVELRYLDRFKIKDQDSSIIERHLRFIEYTFIHRREFIDDLSKRHDDIRNMKKFIESSERIILQRLIPGRTSRDLRNKDSSVSSKRIGTGFTSIFLKNNEFKICFSILDRNYTSFDISNQILSNLRKVMMEYERKDKVLFRLMEDEKSRNTVQLKYVGTGKDLNGEYGIEDLILIRNLYLRGSNINDKREDGVIKMLDSAEDRLSFIRDEPKNLESNNDKESATRNYNQEVCKNDVEFE